MRLFGTIYLVFWLAACGLMGDAKMTPIINRGPPNLLSLVVTPSLHTMALGSTKAFAATGTYTDLSSSDITGSVKWTLSGGTGSAMVGTSTGIVSAVGGAAGTVTVTAMLGSISDSVTIAITDADYLFGATSFELLKSRWASFNSAQSLSGCSFTASPNLPKGLSIGADGKLSGVPTTLVGPEAFQIYGTCGARTHSAIQTLTVYTETLNLASFEIVGGATLPATTLDGAVEKVNGILYKFGGASAGQWACGVGADRISTSTDKTTWIDRGIKLAAKYDYGGVRAIVGDYLYLFGSYCNKTIQRASLTNLIDGWEDTGGVIPFANGHFISIYQSETTLYLFGGGDGTAIWSAPVSDPKTWTNTGAYLPGGVQYGNLFSFEEKIYIVMGGSVYVANKDSPTIWATQSTGGTWSGNSGGQIIVGDYAYLLGGHNNDNIFRTPISDWTAWGDTGADLPAAGFWGANNWIRVDNEFYVFGGPRSAPLDTYKGSTTILRAQINRVNAP